MNKEINLIGDKRQQVLREERKVRITRIIAVVSLMSILISAGVIFWLNQNTPIAQLTKEETLATNSLNVLRQKTASVLLINERLKNISALMATHSTFDSTIDTLSSIIPNEVAIEGIGITKKNISLSLSSSSLSSLEDLFTTITTMVNTKKLFKKIIIGGVIYDGKSGRYIVTIDAESL